MATKDNQRGDIDLETSWEDSSVDSEISACTKISPVSWPIILLNFLLPFATQLLLARYTTRTPFFNYVVFNVLIYVIYPGLMMRYIKQLRGVWARVKNTQAVERNRGKAVGCISFFLFMIFVSLWSLAPQLQNIKPYDDELDKKHIFTVILVIEIVIGGLFFVMFGPLLHNFYWTMYVYECFGYSIRLGILKWIICFFYAISFYNLFHYVDGPVVGLLAVIFFVFYARLMLWMKRKFGFIPIVL